MASFLYDSGVDLSVRSRQALQYAVLALAIGIAPIASVPTIASLLSYSASGTSEADAQEQSVLVASVQRELANLPVTATSEDMEAAIMFAISQSSASDQSVEAALSVVAASGGTPALQQALANARRAIANRKKRGRGTAAIGGGAGFGITTLAPPSIGGGGGSTSYSQ